MGCQKSDSLCSLFWTATDISRTGVVRPCCMFQEIAKEGSGPLRVGETHPTIQVLQSAQYRRWRADSLAGREIPGCDGCYQKERDGGRSDRMIYNQVYRQRMNLPDDVSLAEHFGADPEGLVQLTDISLHVGSTCNLKCRMCNPNVSSRIAGDELHARWARWGLFGDDSYTKPAKNEVNLDEDVVIADMLKDLSGVKRVKMSGGEPFAVPGIARTLRKMIDSGHADHIELGMPSNGTLVTDELIDLLRQFQKITLRLSIDAVGPANEYVRWGADWNSVQEAAGKFRTLSNAWLMVGFTLCAYNVFEAGKVAQWAADNEFKFEWGIVRKPWYLSPEVLPASVLRRAADYTRQCEQRIGSWRAQELSAVANRLESLATTDRPEGYDTFVEYTNDLDASRKQRLTDAMPDLAAALESAVGPWDTTRHKRWSPETGKVVQLGLPKKKKRWALW